MKQFPSFDAPKDKPQPKRKRDIMSFEEYAEKSHKLPYVFKMKKGDKELAYYGAPHSFDPEHPMFDDIEEKFNQAKPDLVLVEGISDLEDRKQEAVDWVKARDRDAVIKEMGEPGFGLKLAVDAGVDFDSPEPSYKDEINHLVETGFNKEEVFAYYMYRTIDQYHRLTDAADIEEYLEKFIAPFKKATNWKDFDYSITNLKKIGKNIWKDDKNFTDPGLAKERVDPTPWKHKKKKQTKVNEIAREVSYFRDEFIVDKVEQYLKTKNRVFIVYGASHAYMQQPALRKVMAKK